MPTASCGNSPRTAAPKPPTMTTASTALPLAFAVSSIARAKLRVNKPDEFIGHGCAGQGIARKPT